MTINGVTISTNVNVAFTADATGTATTSPVSLVMSYNNYYFNYTLPAIACTIAQADHVTVLAITIPSPILSFPNRASYSQKCQLLLNKFQEQTLTWALPLPLFQSNEWIPPIVMALIGTLRWRGETNVLASVTGANRDSIGGCMWTV